MGVARCCNPVQVLVTHGRREQLYGALMAEEHSKADLESLTLGRDDRRGAHRS